MCPYWELFCPLHTNQHIKTRLVFNTGSTGAGTLSQANIYRPECSIRVALYSFRIHSAFASQYLLAMEHLYRLELIEMGSTTKRDILPGILGGS